MAGGWSSFCWKDAFLYQLLSHRQHVRMVHCKGFNGDPSDPGDTDLNRSVPSEVLGPVVLSGMKQAYQLAAVWVYARDVRSLVEIATVAGQR